MQMMIMMMMMMMMMTPLVAIAFPGNPQEFAVYIYIYSWFFITIHLCSFRRGSKNQASKWFTYETYRACVKWPLLCSKRLPLCCLKKKPQDQEEEDGWCYLYLMAIWHYLAISWACHRHFMLLMAGIHNSDIGPERNSAASKKTPQHEEAHSTNRADLHEISWQLTISFSIGHVINVIRLFLAAWFKRI